MSANRSLMRPAPTRLVTALHSFSHWWCSVLYAHPSHPRTSCPPSGGSHAFRLLKTTIVVDHKHVSAKPYHILHPPKAFDGHLDAPACLDWTIGLLRLITAGSHYRHVLGLPRGSLPQTRCKPAQVSSHAIRGQSTALRPVELSGIAVVFNSNHLLLASASLQHRDQQPDSLRLLHRQRPSLIDQVADKRAGKVVDSPLSDRFL